MAREREKPRGEVQRGIPRRRRKKDKPEKPVLSEKAREQALLSTVLNHLAFQGVSFLRGPQRTRVGGLTTAIFIPDTEKLSIGFTVIDGALIDWRGAVAAFAYGSVEEGDDLVFLGGIHNKEHLLRKGINLTDPRHFSLLFGEYPGEFLSFESHVALWGKRGKQTDTVQLIIGDENPAHTVSLTIPGTELLNVKRKGPALVPLIKTLNDMVDREFR